MTARVLSTDGHVEGRSVSVHTYRAYGCRCEACRETNRLRVSAYRRTYGPSRSERAQSKAQGAAATWVRREHPEVWRRLLNEAYASLGEER